MTSDTTYNIDMFASLFNNLGQTSAPVNTQATMVAPESASTADAAMAPASMPEGSAPATPVAPVSVSTAPVSTLTSPASTSAAPTSASAPSSVPAVPESVSAAPESVSAATTSTSQLQVKCTGSVIATLTLPVTNNTIRINPTLTINGEEYYTKTTVFDVTKQPCVAIVYHRYVPASSRTMTTNVIITTPDGQQRTLQGVCVSLDCVRDMLTETSSIVTDSDNTIRNVANTPEITEFLRTYDPSRELVVTSVSYDQDPGPLLVVTDWSMPLPDTVSAILDMHLPEVTSKQLCTPYSQQFIKHINTLRSVKHLPPLTHTTSETIAKCYTTLVSHSYDATALDTIVINNEPVQNTRRAFTRPCLIQAKQDITPDSLANVVFDTLTADANEDSLLTRLLSVSDGNIIALALPCVISVTNGANNVTYECMTLLVTTSTTDKQ